MFVTLQDLKYSWDDTANNTPETDERMLKTNLQTLIHRIHLNLKQRDPFYKQQIKCDEFEKKVSLLEERCQVLSDGRILFETSFYNSKAFFETFNIQIRAEMEKISDTG